MDIRRGSKSGNPLQMMLAEIYTPLGIDTMFSVFFAVSVIVDYIENNSLAITGNEDAVLSDEILKMAFGNCFLKSTLVVRIHEYVDVCIRRGSPPSQSIHHDMAYFFKDRTLLLGGRGSKYFIHEEL